MLTSLEKLTIASIVAATIVVAATAIASALPV
jgi:hypothetical protein